MIHDSAAQKAGVKEGDEILKIDGTKIADRTDLTRLPRVGEPKKVVSILRDGKEVDLSVSWDPPAAASSKPQEAIAEAKRWVQSNVAKSFSLPALFVLLLALSLFGGTLCLGLSFLRRFAQLRKPSPTNPPLP